MKCHYEVLGVERTAGADDLKRAYRRLALIFHPDKNPDDPESAKESFQSIQQAYDVLSDPQERAWYDDHREAIIRGYDIGSGNGTAEKECLDLFRFFSASCYKGKDFYSVYSEVFETIAKEDDDEGEYPSFGTADSPEEEWREFYAFYSGYVTTWSFSWLDKYDTRKAENRRVARLMEKENKKIRDKARKERNELVRALANFVKKRDKRVQAYNALLKEKAAKNAQKTEDFRRKKLLERAELMKESSSNNSFIMTELENELQNLEELYDSEEEERSLYCQICDKKFRNPKTRDIHFRSQNHIENELLYESLINEEENSRTASEDNEDPEENSETLKPSDDDNESENDKKKKKKKKKKPEENSRTASEDNEDPEENSETLKPSDDDNESENDKKKKKKKKKHEENSRTASEDNEDPPVNIQEENSETLKPSDNESENDKKKKKKKQKKPEENSRTASEDNNEDPVNNSETLKPSDDDNESENDKKKKKKKKKKPEENSRTASEDNEISVNNSETLKPSDDNESENDKKKKKKKKKKPEEEDQKKKSESSSKLKVKKPKRTQKKDEEEVVSVVVPECSICHETFQSRNKLFSHLKSTGHTTYIPK